MIISFNDKDCRGYCLRNILERQSNLRIHKSKMLSYESLLINVFVFGLIITAAAEDPTTSEPSTTPSTTTTEKPLPPIYTCTLNEANYCIFKDVNPDFPRYRFRPQAENTTAEEITKVLFESSSLSIFGEDICNAFPNLEFLGLDNTEVRTFDNDAFINCSKLFVLSARNNYIYELKTRSLQGLKSLQVLRLSNNEIATISTDVFWEMEDLRELDLGYNKIKEFSTALVKNLCELVELRLEGNELFDLDVETMAGPVFGHVCLKSLQLLGFDDSNLNCHRIPSILKSLKAKSIGAPKVFLYRHRSFSTKLVEGYKCYGEAEWAALYHRWLSRPSLNEIRRMIREEL